jgi:hypothetical protein
LQRRLLEGGALAVAACLATGVTMAVAATTSASMGSSSTSGQTQLTGNGAGTHPSLPASGTAGPSAGRADKDLKRTGPETVAAGALAVPASFRSDDGVFDLLVHFHGSAVVVAESAAAAKLNAVVYVSNADGGKKYWKRFQSPQAFAQLLEDVRAHLAKKGLRDARLGRLALSSWSSGYGALIQILHNNKHADAVDAVLILEGLHARWVNERRRLVDKSSLSALIQFGRAATERSKLLAISHSGVVIEDLADSGTVSNVILSELGVKREPTSGQPPKVEIRGAATMFPDKQQRWLEAATAAKSGDLHVLGFRGGYPGHHIPHLVQMSVTVLPLLRDRWNRPRPPG